MSDTEESSSRSITPEPSDTKKLSEPPLVTPRVSLPLRYGDPNDSDSVRPVDDITPDEIVVRTGTSFIETTDLIQNVTTTLEEVDRFVGTTQNILDQTIREINMSGPEETQNLIDVQIQSQDLPGTSQQNVINEETNQSLPIEDSLGSEAISLEAALKLLPNSFNGENQEDMEIFLEKCEFALSCTNKRVQTRLLQGITVRLTGKARQAIKFRTFDSWTSLRDTLKAALEPQRTTTHLFLELYSSKQKIGEDVLTYSSRIEKLQSIIIEQETNGKSLEVAKALEASFKQQTVQVFIEGLGPLKDFIKARNPTTLEKAVQAAREEERVRKSAEESRRLYGHNSSNRTNLNKANNQCFFCKQKGHWTRDCQSKNSNNPNRTSGNSNNQQINSENQRNKNIRIISCNYCKKPGHTKDVCRKLRYVQGNRNNSKTQDWSENRPQKSGNQEPQTSNGGRSAGQLKTAVVTFPQSS